MSSCYYYLWLTQCLLCCDSHSHLEVSISSLHHEKGLFVLSMSLVSSEGLDKSKEVNLILKIQALTEKRVS